MICGVLALVLLGAPAAAHTDVISVSPADGTRLDRAPRQLVLRFSDEMNPELSTVTLQVDGGASTTLDVTNGGSRSTVVAQIPGSLAGDSDTVSRWRVAFRVVSADGHPVAGDFSFSVRPSTGPDEGDAPTEGASESEPPVAEPTEAGGDDGDDGDDSGVPWVLIAIPVAVLGVLVLLVLAAMRLLRRDEE